MTPSSEFNDVGRIIQTPMPEMAYSDGIATQHFYPKSKKQFVNKIATSPKLVKSYYVRGDLINNTPLLLYFY